MITGRNKNRSWNCRSLTVFHMYDCVHRADIIRKSIWFIKELNMTDLIANVIRAAGTRSQ